jgi:hypothetical protein
MTLENCLYTDNGLEIRISYLYTDGRLMILICCLYTNNSRLVILLSCLYRDSKGKGHPMTWLCRQRGEAGAQLQPTRNPVLEEVGGQHHSSAALFAGKTRFLLYRRLGWARGRSRRRRGIAS